MILRLEFHPVTKFGKGGGGKGARSKSDNWTYVYYSMVNLREPWDIFSVEFIENF